MKYYQLFVLLIFIIFIIFIVSILLKGKKHQQNKKLQTNLQQLKTLQNNVPNNIPNNVPNNIPNNVPNNIPNNVPNNVIIPHVNNLCNEQTAFMSTENEPSFLLITPTNTCDLNMR